MKAAVLAMALVFVPDWAAAEVARPLAENPEIEVRVKHLAAELRCLVCQNQTLADSHAPLAEDLRREVRDMVAKGKTDAEIIEFLVGRYGDFVLYRPPWKATTVALWLGPSLLLAAGMLLLGRAIRRRARSAEAPFLSDEDRRRLAEVLAKK